MISLLSNFIFKTMFLIGTLLMLPVIILSAFFVPINITYSLLLLLPILILILIHAKMVLCSKNILKNSSAFTYTLIVIYLTATITIGYSLITKQINISSSIRNIALTANAINGALLKRTPNDRISDLVQDCIKFSIKEALLPTNILPKQEHFLDYTVDIEAYSSFRGLFTEIFIHKIYYFTTNTDAPLIIDCGSNIGMSIIYFKYLFPNSRIIGFEPDRGAFDILTNNITRNDLKDVTLYNKAIYNYDGTISFFSQAPGSVINSIHQDWVHTKHEVKLPCTKLSNYINETVHLLKMDIEGAEIESFEELSANGKLKFIQQIIMEFHHHLKPDQDNLSKIINILENNNFGYQISAELRPPFKAKEDQCFLIYAYQK